MKHKTILGYSAIGLILIAVGVAFIKPVSANSILFRARAANLNNLSVTFSRSTGTQTVLSTNYYYTSGTTSLGNTFYLRNASNVSLGSTYVAAMCGTFDKGNVEPELNFTTSNTSTSGKSLFEFKNIKSISAVSDSANTRSLTVLKSQDGSNWTSAGTLDVTSSGGTNTDVSGAKYIKLTYSDTYTVKLSSFTINYSCSDEPEPEKELSSISVSGQTTEFTVGDSFEFGGTVTAHYSDSSSADVTSSATFSGYNMSQAGEQSVMVSYTEDNITKTANYNIDVSSTGAVTLSGTYNYQSRSVHTDGTDWTGCMTLTFTSNGKCTWRNVRGTSIVYDCKVFFDYVAYSNGTNIELTMTICDGEDSDKYDYRMQGNPTTSASAFSGGTIDRPANNGITKAGAGNSGIVSLNKQSLTVSVYQYANSSYSYYDTFTFSLVS